MTDRTSSDVLRAYGLVYHRPISRVHPTDVAPGSFAMGFTTGPTICPK